MSWQGGFFILAMVGKNLILSPMGELEGVEVILYKILM
jgi:hypothetical protein